MAIIALLNRSCRSARRAYFARHFIAFNIADRGFVTRNRDPIAFLQIADLLGERRKCERIGTKIHLPLAMPNHQRRSEPRADQHIGVIAKGDGECKGAAQARQYGLHRIFRRVTRLDLAADQMDNRLGVGFTLEAAAICAQLVTQFLEILNDAIVDERHALGRVRVRVLFGWCAMGCPACMGDTGFAGSRIASQLLNQIVQLTFGTAADQFAIVDRADARAVIAAIFHPAQAIDHPLCHMAIADNSDNSAHIAWFSAALMREFGVYELMSECHRVGLGSVHGKKLDAALLPDFANAGLHAFGKLHPRRHDVPPTAFGPKGGAKVRLGFGQPIGIGVIKVTDGSKDIAVEQAQEGLAFVTVAHLLAAFFFFFMAS